MVINQKGIADQELFISNEKENNTMAESNINILQNMSMELNKGERKCIIKMTSNSSDTFNLEVIVRDIECFNDTVTIYTEPGEFMYDLRTSNWEMVIDDDGWKVYKAKEDNGNYYYFCFI